jgi:two-component system response regulator HydG
MALKHRLADLLLLDLKLPGGAGLDLLREVKERHPETAVIVMTAFATVSSAVEAMRIGASDYLTKPFALEELTSVLKRSASRLHFDIQSRRLRESLRTQNGMETSSAARPRWRRSIASCRRSRSRLTRF